MDWFKGSGFEHDGRPDRGSAFGPAVWGLGLITLIVAASLVEEKLEGPPITVLEALEQSSDCFVTKQNVVVRHVGKAKCPKRKKITNLIDKTIMRQQWPFKAAEGCVFIYTDRWPVRTGHDNWSAQEGTVSVVRSSFDSNFTFVHNLGHCRKVDLLGRDDPEHNDCDFWHALDGTKCPERIRLEHRLKPHDQADCLREGC